MINLDTNILVRALVEDDAVQSAKAQKLLISLTVDNPGHISLVALVEMLWILQSIYRKTRDDVARAVGVLLNTATLRIEQAGLVEKALELFRGASKVDFGDCLIQCSGTRSGCEHTVTFDRTAAKKIGMRLL